MDRDSSLSKLEPNKTSMSTADSASIINQTNPGLSLLLGDGEEGSYWLFGIKDYSIKIKQER